MAKFMILCRGGEVDAPQYQTHMQKWRSWLRHLIEAGKLISGEPLMAAGTRVSGRARSIAPYAPGPDEVGGYVFLSAASLRDALEISKDCPHLDVNGVLEIREIASIEE